MTGKGYILCIDVVEEDCELLTEALHSFNPDIELAFVSSGDRAVEFVKSRPERIPTFLILDINIPGMDGTETFLALKAVLGQDVYPAAFLTTRPNPVDVAFAEKHGLLVMEKPNNMDGYRKLAETIFEILETESPSTHVHSVR